MKFVKAIINIFKKPETQSLPDVLFPALVSAEQFSAFNSNQRIQAVMIVGDSGDVKFYEFMKWCIKNDPDPGVKFAALKRLPNFSVQKELSSFLRELDLSNDRFNLEPYLSMTLCRLSLINEDEMTARLNDNKH